jgi:ABC-type nickel/cobalt efflux system permease component RcnA
MTGLLLLGFLLGIRHALEADHVAAVAALAARSGSLKQTIRLGAVWGVGHSLALFLFGALILIMDTIVPDQLAQALEFAVGVMLIFLGADLLYRLYRKRIHFHIHRHASGKVHFHAHSHAGERNHDPAGHDHAHPKGFPFRALLVGLMHGMAGSAALILLTLQTVESQMQGFIYIALFGIGSIVGMALLSMVIAIPLRRSAAGLTRLHNVIQSTVGVATVVFGLLLMYEVGVAGNS